MFKSSPLTSSNNILGEYIEPMLWSFDITNTFINIYNFWLLARRLLLIYCFVLDVVKSHLRNLKHLILGSCFVLNQNYSDYHYYTKLLPNLHDFSSNCLIINIKMFVCIMNVTSHQILPNAFVASSQSKRFMKMSISPYLTYSVSHYLWLFGYHLLFACIHLMNKNIDNKNPNNISNFFGFGIGENRMMIKETKYIVEIKHLKKNNQNKSRKLQMHAYINVEFLRKKYWQKSTVLECSKTSYKPCMDTR